MSIKQPLSYIINTAYFAVIVMALGGVLLDYFPRLRWQPIGRVIYALYEFLARPFRRVRFLTITSGRFTFDLVPLSLMLSAMIIYFALIYLVHLLPF
jgi:hypothetical protein